MTLTDDEIRAMQSAADVHLKSVRARRIDQATAAWAEDVMALCADLLEARRELEYFKTALRDLARADHTCDEGQCCASPKIDAAMAAWRGRPTPERGG